MRLTMPDTSDIDDPTLSKYEITPQARLLCEIVEKIERRELMRAAVAISPQMGKSQVLTRGGPAWISGRDPSRHIMVGAYNQTFAQEFGDDVRTIMGSNVFRGVFPQHGCARARPTSSSPSTAARSRSSASAAPARVSRRISFSSTILSATTRTRRARATARSSGSGLTASCSRAATATRRFSSCIRAGMKTI
jgi:hypothetical protein